MRASTLLLAACSAIAIAISPPVHACSKGPLLNYGGKIDAKPNVTFVYWGGGVAGVNTQDISPTALPVLSSRSGASYGLGGTRWWGQVAQYSDVDMQSGTNEAALNPADVLAASDVNDAHNLPAAGTQVTETQVQTEVDYLVSHNLIPGHNADTIVMMFLPPKVTPPVEACGLHSTSAGGNPYAWITYPGVVAMCDTGWVQQAIGHEIVESVLNPQVIVGNTPGTQGWDQASIAACEIGDICEATSFMVQVQPESVETRTQPYWSNEALAAGGFACVYGRSTNAFLFGLGTDSHLYAENVQAQTLSNVWNAGWTYWGSGNGNTVQYVFRPAAASWGPNRLDAFALSDAGQMWHAWSDNAGATVSWEPRDTLPAGVGFSTQYENSAPDAVSWGAGNIQVFAFGDDDNLYRDMFDSGGWWGWQMITTPTVGLPYSKITVASAGATGVVGDYPTDLHTVNLAYIDTYNRVQFGSLVGVGTTPTWSSYENFGGFYAQDLDMAIWAPGRADVFVRDSGNNLWDCVSGDQQTLGTCYEWSSPADGAFDAGLGVAALGDGRLLVAGRVNGNGREAAYFSFWDQNGATAWNGTYQGNPNGILIGGVDVASW
jgi:hypothetical protein